MMGFEIKGLDEVQKHLEKLAKNAQELDGEHVVPFEELFPSEFLKEYTSVSTVQQLMNESGLNISNQEDFNNIPDEEWDEYIRKVTSFSDWQDMLDTAVKEYTIRKLGL